MNEFNEILNTFTYNSKKTETEITYAKGKQYPYRMIHVEVPIVDITHPKEILYEVKPITCSAQAFMTKTC